MSTGERTLAPVGPSVRIAEELLRRAGCLGSEHPRIPDSAGTPLVDLDLLAESAHLLDLSEEGVVRVAVSLATGRPVDLRSALGFLSRDHAELVMIAVAAAGGHDRVESRIGLVDGQRRVESVPPLGVWPD